MAHTAEAQTDTPVEQTTLEPKQEERIVDRGEVDFNRSLPNRPQTGSGSSLYHPHSEPTAKSGLHQSIWNNAPSDRRPSADRTPGHYSTQRSEFGNRDGYHGPQRRDSFGPKDSFSGPPRRDSGGYRDSHHDRREYNRPGAYNRDRDRDSYHHRDHDYPSDRRPGYDRPPYTSERLPDRNQRDFQLLTRPKEASPSDRQGSTDPHTSGPDAHSTPNSHEPHGSAIPNHIHNPPSEYDRPTHVTEDQRETMKHAAEEARKRREEEEKVIEESAARARAKAAELARKAEEEKRVKEEAAAAAAKESATKEDAQTIIAVDDTSSTSSKSLSSTIAKTPRDSGYKPLTDSQREEAMTKWRQLPGQLMAEHAESKNRNKEEYRRQERERQARKASASQSTPQGVNDAQSPKSPEPVDESKTTIADQTPNHSESQKEIEPTNQVTSGTLPTSGQSNDEVRTCKNNDERQSGDAVAAIGPLTNLPLTPFQKTRGLPGDQSVKADSTPEVMAKQPDNAVHKTEEKSHGHLDSAQADTSTTVPGAQANQPHAQVDKPILKERTRNGKAGRGHADSAASWRKAEAKPEVSSQSKASTTPNGEANLDNAQGQVKNGKVLTILEKVEKGSYPAKLKGVNGTRKISQITIIHARLAMNAAGNTVVEQSNEKSATSGTSHSTANKSTESLTVKERGAKRQSLLNAATPIIFPSMVESAARKRGSMSFMVESEVGDPSTEQKAPIRSPEEVPSSDNQPTTVSQWDDNKTTLPQPEQTQEKDVPMEDSAKRAWESASATTSGAHAEPGNLKQGDSHHPGMAMGPGIFMVNGSGPGVVNAMNTQPMWNGSIPGDSTNQSGAAMTPPYPMMMPYYPQGFPVNGPPMFYMYPRGPIPAHMAQFPGGVLPAHGSMPHTPRDANIGPGATLGSSELTNTSGDMALDGTLGNTASVGNSAGVLAPHHWPPHFSTAGDTPPHQANMVGGGSFMISLPMSQQQASLMAAAQINRAPQSRPFPHQQPPHSRLGTGPGSLENNFQEGSPGSTDGWGNSTGLAATNSNGNNSSNNNSRSHTHGTHGASGSSSTWNSGNGRLHSNANTGPNGVSTAGNTYNAYGGGGYTQPSSQHPHPNSNHRGGRGYHHNGHQGAYREYKSKTYNGGHMNQVHHGTYSYGHGNVSANGGNQHGGSSPVTPSSVGSMDTQQHGHHQGIQHSHGRTMNHEGNAPANSFGSSSFSHRSPHASGTVAATTSSGIQF